jgi:hypothetical protein
VNTRPGSYKRRAISQPSSARGPLVYQRGHAHRDFLATPEWCSRRRALTVSLGWLLFDDDALVGSTRNASDAVRFVALGVGS